MFLMLIILKLIFKSRVSIMNLYSLHTHQIKFVILGLKS